MALAFALAGQSLLAGCGLTDISGPDTAPPIPGAVRYSALPVYISWWQDVINCSGRSRGLSAVQWYKIPGVSSFNYRGSVYGGYWWSSRKIVVAESLVEHSDLVRHEMLHDILNVGGHPPEYFNEKCAGVVVPYRGPSQSLATGSATPEAQGVHEAEWNCSAAERFGDTGSPFDMPGIIRAR